MLSKDSLYEYKTPSQLVPIECRNFHHGETDGIRQVVVLFFLFGSGARIDQRIERRNRKQFCGLCCNESNKST